MPDIKVPLNKKLEQSLSSMKPAILTRDMPCGMRSRMHNDKELVIKMNFPFSNEDRNSKELFEYIFYLDLTFRCPDNGNACWYM